MSIAALIEAVEAGTAGWNHIATLAEAVMPIWEAQLAANAYTRDLSAAMALHEALLPGWEWERDCHGGMIVTHYDGEFRARDIGDPARTWLLAILRAKEAGQ